MEENDFKKLHGFFIEDLEIGQKATLSKKITEDDINQFSQITGDDNPVHVNEDFAKQTIFKKRIAHGFLSASLISTVIATKLPGPGSIYISQSLKFLAPVFIDEEINVNIVVLEINREKKRVKLLTECFKSEKRILTGEAEILVNSKREQKI
ncbi:MAG: MaoC family dehydratase [Pseudomonadota bacterium]|nr:MaoC family dehydratase [Pseudomonadota bacterium]